MCGAGSLTSNRRNESTRLGTRLLKIHLDGGDDYLDCDLLICCTTVWLDATDARVSPLRRGASDA